MTTRPTDDPQLCVTQARQAAEPLIGTAIQGAFHFVMSWPKREWTAKVEEMDGPPGDFARAVLPLKGQAIFTLKAGPSEEAGTVWLFPHGLRFDDLPPAGYVSFVNAALGGDRDHPGIPVTATHTLMLCGHGKRDVCCAMFGGQVLRALQAECPPEVAVWEVSHLGGHRFAGTLVVQPANQWYGLLTPEDAPALLSALAQGDILSEKYRGNASYPPPLQVAERWGYDTLRAAGQTGQISLVNPCIEGQHAEVEVSLSMARGSETYRLTLRGEPYTFFPNSHSDATKDRLIWHIERQQQYGKDY